MTSLEVRALFIRPREASPASSRRDRSTSDMALGSTLFRIQASVSDVDAGIYESFTLRVAQHSSEDSPRLATRVLAYCLAYEQDLSFGRGLDEANDPALFLKDATGNLEHWIDIGHPGAERIHRASKAAARVSIFCHKPAAGLIRERSKRAIHKVDKISIWLLAPDFVEAIGEAMGRNNDWTVMRTGNDLLVNIDDQSFSGEIRQTTLAELS